MLQVNSVVADGEVHIRPQDLCNLALTTYNLMRYSGTQPYVDVLQTLTPKVLVLWLR